MNFELGVYPEISDKKFYKKILSKKELTSLYTPDEKELYCLQSHQTFLQNFMTPLTNYNSLLIFHEVGTGKTLTSIAITEKFKDDYSILILSKNRFMESIFIKELLNTCSNYSHLSIDKAKEDIKQHYDFITYQTLVNKLKVETVNTDNTVLVIDEVHNILNNEIYHSIYKMIKRSKNIKVILLSATPVFDDVKEIFEICNLLGDNLPIRWDLSKSGYITQRKTDKNLLTNQVDYLSPLGEAVIQNSLKGKISYLVSDKNFFPRKEFIGVPISGSINVFLCKMSSYQRSEYIKTLNDNKNDTLFKKISDVSTISEIQKGDTLELKHLKKYSCKLYNILKNIQESTGPVFIYSNYVEKSGISLISKILLSNGYSKYGLGVKNKTFVVISDKLTTNRRNNIIKTFNSKENVHGEIIKIIVGSPIISEGITFKNINQIHILEPSWNMSRIDQVIGRGVRYMSHSLLPLKERKVKIFLYAAIADTLDNSIDYLKYVLSINKDKAIKRVEELMRYISIDCSFNYKTQKAKDYSRECLYSKCQYRCKGIIPKSIDYNTYSLKIHDTPRYNYIVAKIHELFKSNFFFDIKYILKFVNKGKFKINPTHLYIVLDEFIKKRVPMENKLGKKCNLVAIKNIYIINPEGNEINEQSFNKMYKSILEQNFETDNKITRRSIKIVDKPMDSEVYGSFIDKYGNKDSTFRIILNTGDTSKDKRKIITGKVCNSFEKPELLNIIKKLSIDPPENPTKAKLCSLIQKHLQKNNFIV